MSKISKPKKSQKTVIMVALIIVAVMVVATIGYVVLNEPKLQESAYMDIDAVMKNPDEDVMEIGDTYFSDAPYELNSGWYYVISSIALPDDLTISGDVKIILKNNIVLTANVKILPGSELYVYSQSWNPDIVGVLTSTSNTISLTDGSSLTNTALISASSENCIDGTGTIKIVNGVSGLIHGHEKSINLSGDGSIINYGDIMSKSTPNGHAIYSNASSVNIINEEFGLIRGSVGIGASNTTKVTLLNKSTISGEIKLDNATSDITLMIGKPGLRSSIHNDFIIKGNESVLRFTGDLGISTYSSYVGGNVDIGEGVITVSINVENLSSTLKVGDVMTLIQSDATVTGTPSNSVFSEGGYSFEIFTTENQINVKVTEVPSG